MVVTGFFAQCVEVTDGQVVSAAVSVRVMKCTVMIWRS